MNDLPAPHNGSDDDDNDLRPTDVRTFAAVVATHCTCQWLYDAQEAMYELIARRRGCPIHYWAGEMDV